MSKKCLKYVKFKEIKNIIQIVGKIKTSSEHLLISFTRPSLKHLEIATKYAFTLTSLSLEILSNDHELTR